MVFFWKVFAWIAFAWSAVFRRGQGIAVTKKGTPSDDGPRKPRTEGPGWRLVSTKVYGVEPEAPAPPETPGEPGAPAVPDETTPRREAGE
ncbi:MAG: hypothetical protein AAGF23_22570 [Acidobacteriota bacterium]